MFAGGRKGCIGNEWVNKGIKQNSTNKTWNRETHKFKNHIFLDKCPP